MSRWIDADALKRRVQRVATEAWKLKLEAKVETTLNQFLDYVEQFPSIDIVRCGECKYCDVWESMAGNELYCEKQRVCPYDWGMQTAFYVKADDFCSYGERKEQ